MATRGFLRLWAAAGAVALALIVSGCQAGAQPPAGAGTAVDQAAATIRATPGVAGVIGTLASRGGSYGAPSTEPVQWSAHFTVRTEGTGVALPGLAASVAADALLGVVPTTVVLLAPGENGAADVELTFSSVRSADGSTAEQLAEAAGALRDLAGVATVSVYPDGRPVTLAVDAAASFADLVVALRAVPGFGAGALAAATVHDVTDESLPLVSLTVDAASPGVGLLSFLDELNADTALTRLSFDGVIGRATPHSWRPTLNVVLSAPGDIDGVTGRLAAIGDSVAQVDGVPRTAFSVAASTGSASALTGYVGLPPGSAEPDDTLTALAAAVAPDEADARIESDSALLSALLDAAGDDAGIRGPATVSTTTCATGTGEQVQGSVVIPIFEIADSADAAFDAITAAWESADIDRTDRAMGRDFYTARDGSLESLSIRGTIEGISIMALAPCVRSNG